MRNAFAMIVIAAALVAAAPAQAQRASLADRVAALEQRSSDNSANLDLLNQLGQLRSEIQALRSQVEELQQQNEQLRSTNRSQYLDLDGRLNRLEDAGVQTGEGEPQASAPAARDNAAPGRTGAAAQAPAEQVDNTARTGDERRDYETAFSALRSGQYADSARLFQAFLQTHPEGSYAANARYWLAESYYVTQNYGRALEQFQALLNQHPGHDKAPGALLKIGLSQYGLRDLEAAEQTLASVGKQFPGSDAAQTAEDRLHAIRLARLSSR